MDISKLFEHPITRSSQISLADQIHDILCEEIHAGRWKIDEKLPSMMVIANQCGVSRMPVQQAIEQLGEEGYVRQENRSGIFLASQMPEGSEPLGTIGVVVLSDPQNDREADHLAFEQLLVHRIMGEAPKRNYRIRVYYANAQEDWENINRVGRVFDRDIRGIISLVPFEHAVTSQIADDRIPLVFLGEPNPCCAPCVASDYEMALYQLTSKVIAQGHTRIEPIAHPPVTETLAETYLRGYRKAMEAHGLPHDESCYEESNNVGAHDSVGLKEVLLRHGDITAFICLHADRLVQTINTLTLMGVSVPGEVSVVGTNPPLGPLPNGQTVGGVTYSPEDEIDACFQLLREQRLSRKPSIATILMNPVLIDGDTLAAK